MITQIEIVSGPYQGQRFELSENMTLGRSSTDIIIQDSKVSARHAQVKRDEKGLLILVDLESSNGIRINGQRVKKVSLIQGVTFEIGRTLFRVIETQNSHYAEHGSKVKWRTLLKAKLEDPRIFNGLAPSDVTYFSQPLTLSFIKGIQADQEIILGYGPRKIGSDSLDVELLDKDAPSLAFTLKTKGGFVEIENISTAGVMLNNLPFKSDILKEGDLITVGNTVIKVSYR